MSRYNLLIFKRKKILRTKQKKTHIRVRNKKSNATQILKKGPGTIHGSNKHNNNEKT